MLRIAVYPGSFDPVTNGHIDIIKRACRLFDRVIVAVSNNSAKRHTFSAKERMRMIKESTRSISKARVDTFDGLLVDYLKKKKAYIIIRGVRVVSDMDYEFQMASMNRQLLPHIETVFLMPDERFTYLSSSIIKDVTKMGAVVKEMVPPAVSKMLRTRRSPEKSNEK